MPCAERRIVVESWSPLGPSTRLLSDPRLAAVAARYGKSPAQVVLRWHIEHGLVTIPKSASPKRLRENFEMFDFTLGAEDLELLDSFGQHAPARYASHLAGHR